MRKARILAAALTAASLMTLTYPAFANESDGTDETGIENTIETDEEEWTSTVSGDTSVADDAEEAAHPEKEEGSEDFSDSAEESDAITNETGINTMLTINDLRTRVISLSPTLTNV